MTLFNLPIKTLQTKFFDKYYQKPDKVAYKKIITEPSMPTNRPKPNAFSPLNCLSMLEINITNNENAAITRGK